MSTFVTATGLQVPTLAEIKASLETAWQGILGEDIDLSAEGPIGQVIDLMAKSISDAYLFGQETYTARNVNEATGTSLDNIGAETGARRIDASKTRVENVVLYGTESTLVTAGKKVRQLADSLLYSLDSDVTITKTSASDLWLEPNDTTPGVLYTITIDAVPYSYTVLGGDEEGDIIDGLILAMALAPQTTTNEDDTFIRIESIVTPYTSDWTANLDLEKVGTAGDFEADAEGPNSLPTQTLNTISTPVSGWTEVLNPAAGQTGREVETDAEFRIRRANALGAGSATEVAIRAKLLNEVDGVVSVSVTSNRSMVTDGEGRPPKSFEAVVEGGTDEDVATTIWLNMPAGIDSYGTDSEVIVDSEGRNQTINYSRPTNVYLHVKVRRKLYDEEVYPVDGDEAIKQAIVDWSLTQYDLGTDVIFQRIATPVYSVEGIGEVEITVDVTAAPGDTPTLAAANIAVASSTLVIAATSRISVETLP